MKFPSELELKDLTNKSFSFKTLNSLKAFLKKESAFWKKANDHIQSIHSISSSSLSSFSQINAAVIYLDSWSPGFVDWDEATTNQKLIDLKNGYLTPVSSCWIWSGHSLIKPWLSCYERAQIMGDSFIDLLLGKTLNNITTQTGLRGYLLAYEFLEQDESFIPKRRSAERQSFNIVKDQLVKEKSDLVDEVTDFKLELTDWRDNTEKEVSDWIAEQKGKYDGDVSNWNNSINDLETKYQEKLRFDGPATYWNKTAQKLRNQGYFWIVLLVLISTCFVVYLSNFFIAWLQGNKTPLSFQNIEGVVIFASVLSAFAILVRTFSKLAFSSFHLQRDAEEREQLTHLYLSLANETDVDQESRRIVLQALFSRSDTGLLASDSGPTMPSVTEVIKAAGGNR